MNSPSVTYEWIAEFNPDMALMATQIPPLMATSNSPT